MRHLLSSADLDLTSATAILDLAEQMQQVLQAAILDAVIVVGITPRELLKLVFRGAHHGVGPVDVLPESIEHASDIDARGGQQAPSRH